MCEATSPSYLFQSDKIKLSDDPLAFLTDREELQNTVSQLCKKLHHPVALIDYNALMKLDTEKSKSMVEMDAEKLESMVEIFPMRRSCSIFRKCAGEKYCKECDCFHARCMAIDKASIEKRIQEKMKKLPPFFYPEYKDRPPKVLEYKSVDQPEINRPVIEYHCPMLGYRELLFPLKYKGKVFGVFFAGQIMVYDSEDQAINKSISKSFFDKNSAKGLFGAFVDGFNTHNGTFHVNDEDIKKLIVESDSSERQYDEILGLDYSMYSTYTEKKEMEYYSKNFNTQKDYLAFIGTVCSEIAKTEKDLTEAYKKRRNRIYSNKLKEITKDFFDKHSEVHDRTFKNGHEMSTEELKSAWNALETVFASEIIQQFEFVDNIHMFGDRLGIRIETTGKKEIVFSVTNEKNKAKGSFDFFHYSIDGINDSTNSLERPEILAGLSEGLPKENSILIQCHDIAMLIQVEGLDKHNELFTSLAVAIEKELVRINSIIALCSANLMKEKYLLTLRMYRHENSHISTRLMGNINRYFEIENGGKRFLEAEETKRQLVCNDLKNTVQLIADIADNISFVTGTGIAAEEDTKKEVVQFNVADMLYKWQIMFRDELEIRNLEIIVYRGGYDSSFGYKIAQLLQEKILRQSGTYTVAPSVITINARLFELLVYNIVDNAVKYAYIGTNIYLIWSRLENDYELSVTSYGPKMPDGHAMYGLYVRGNDPRYRQGDGLGLYVVKKIAEKLGLKVNNISERISYYNVPLIPWYNRMDFSDIKDYTKIPERELTLNLDEQQVYIATNNYPPTEIKEDELTPEYLLNRIKLETWRTTFRITIPAKNKKNS